MITLKQSNRPPRQIYKVFTKYDDIPDVIRVPFLPKFKATKLPDSADYTEYHAPVECLKYKVKQIKIGLEDVKFILYKRAK